MDIVMSNDLGVQLAKAWGLNPDRVIQMDIVIKTGDPVAIRVLSFLDPESATNLVEMLREYNLTDKVLGNGRVVVRNGLNE